MTGRIFQTVVLPYICTFRCTRISGTLAAPRRTCHESSVYAVILFNLPAIITLAALRRCICASRPTFVESMKGTMPSRMEAFVVDSFSISEPIKPVVPNAGSYARTTGTCNVIIEIHPNTLYLYHVIAVVGQICFLIRVIWGTAKACVEEFPASRFVTVASVIFANAGSSIAVFTQVRVTTIALTTNIVWVAAITVIISAYVITAFLGRSITTSTVAAGLVRVTAAYYARAAHTCFTIVGVTTSTVAANIVWVAAITVIISAYVITAFLGCTITTSTVAAGIACVTAITVIVSAYVITALLGCRVTTCLITTCVTADTTISITGT